LAIKLRFLLNRSR